MKKLILAVGAAMFLAGSAYAASVDGVVKEVNKETKLITLEDGKSFSVPQEVVLPPEVVAGSKVSITVEDGDPTKVVSVTLQP